MNGYSDRPLVAGTVTGIRYWTTHGDGRGLRPIVQGGCWTPGENEAVCHNYFHRLAMLPTVPNQTRCGLGQYGDDLVPSQGCDCGFYAYFDPSAEPPLIAVNRLVRGVVDGYGRVIVGPRGFRAEKARIVALSRPWWWAADGGWVMQELRLYGVPIYGAVDDMVAAHPLTNPEGLVA